MPEITMELPKKEFVNIIGNVTSPFVVLSELIKNGIDANAKSITLFINTNNNSVSIVDNGDGFSEEDIKSLATAAVSRKKREEYVYNQHGQMLLGSKGLAIFSVFSIGKGLQIVTRNKKGACFEVNWENGVENPEYHTVDEIDFEHGTEVKIFGIADDVMTLLTTEKELNKFKHISLYNFDYNLKLPKVIIVKDGEIVDLDVENIEKFSNEFNAKVRFSYVESENKIEYSYTTDNSKIPDKNVTFDLNIPIDIRKKIEEEYSIKTEKLSFDDYLTGQLINRSDISIPDFNGVWHMKPGRKTNLMNVFESGIKLYVNNFALYNYLNKNNDWLQLTNISQNKKANNYKQHNVFGYVNFTNFNDLKEGLKISNERGGFIENIYFHKFMDMIYSIVLYTTINIDIAIKNNRFLHNNVEQRKAPVNRQDTIRELEQGSLREQPRSPVQGKGSDNVISINKDPVIRPDNRKGVSEEKGLGQEENNILKNKKLRVNSGEQVYLKDPTIIKTNKIDELIIVPQEEISIKNDILETQNHHGKCKIDYFMDNKKETLEIQILKRKIKGIEIEPTNFFKTSSHFNGTIDLTGINDVVKQLMDLEYEEKYLLYVISFRAILEDLTKGYLLKRQVPLSGKFKDNITNMLSDLQELLTISKKDPFKVEKNQILDKFKGRDALNNFIVGVNVKFNSHNYDKFLHSLTHNPTRIDKSLALEIANDLILPLYTLINMLTIKKII